MFLFIETFPYTYISLHVAIGKDGHISREYVLRNFLRGYNILEFKFVYISILFLAFFLKKLAYKSMNL